MTAVPETSRHIGWAETITVYLRPRVLIVMFLGLSSGLPLALSGSTLLVWMREAGVDLGTIGLFALVGTPYTIKFLWAPLVDALDVPVLSRLLGRRRGWLVFSQLLLMAATVFLAFTDPAKAPWLVAFGALMVATASATQDIVIDAFRVETLRPNEQAAGMASYVAAYRIGMLVSTAGALFLVTGFESWGLAKGAAWTAGYLAMAACVLIGIVTTLLATEPEKSAAANADHAAHAAENPVRRVMRAANGAFSEFLTREMAIVVLLVRGALQILRRLRRNDDGAVRDRPRLLAQRLRGDREGRRARGDADRRLCRRHGGARAADDHLPVDRRRCCRPRQTWCSPGSPTWAPTTGRSLPRSSRRISPARSAP